MVKDEVVTITKPVSKEKSNTKECKVLFYNNYTGNLAFIYNEKTIQITVPTGLKLENNMVKIQFIDGTYQVI